MATFIVKQFLDLADGVSLPTEGSPLNRSGTDNALTLREGQTAQINLQEILDTLSGVELDAWADLDLNSTATITVLVGYQSSAENFGTDRVLDSSGVVVSANTTLTSAELTTDTAGVIGDGIVDVSLSQGSIAEHITSDHSLFRFFVQVSIDDGY